jgi:hypothetical protein
MPKHKALAGCRRPGLFFATVRAARRCWLLAWVAGANLPARRQIISAPACTPLRSTRRYPLCSPTNNKAGTDKWIAKTATEDVNYSVHLSNANGTLYS